MKKLLLLITCLSLIITTTNSQDNEKPKTAEEILNAATELAQNQDKNVFIMWHASWCGWCKLMDTLMNDPGVKEYFDNSFVIEHMVVKERKELKHLENPGAFDLLTKYKGDKSGIPFWVVLDKNGKLLMDSFMEPGKNTGCPAQQEEVDYWIKVLEETTEITDQGLEKIAHKFLRK